MIELKLRDVAAAARARYEAGTLSAQAPKPICMYRTRQKGVTYACGIGAGLTDDQVDELRAAWKAEDRHSGPSFQLTGLQALPGWKAGDGREQRALFALQQAHDDWANRDTGQEEFLAMLDSILGPAVTPHASDPAAQVRETEETEREAGDDSAND